MRLVPDTSWQRFGRVLVAGSPLKIFRTTAAGARVLDDIESDGPLVASSDLVDRLLDAGAVHPVFDPASDLACPGRLDISDVTVITPRFGGRPAGDMHDGRLVVDDGSMPPIGGAALRLSANQGPATARNAGRTMATTELIAFVDADVELLPNVGIGSWLDALLPHFDDPRVGLVAPRVAGEHGSPLDLGPLPARIRPGTRVSYVPAAAIVVRADAFDAVGGFDSRLRFGEDVDLVWRLDAAGWSCRYEPTSVVWHEPRSRYLDRLRQHAGYGTSAAPLALRHPGALSPVHSNGWTAAAWSTAVMGHPLIGVAIALGSAARLPAKLPDVPRRWALRLAMTGHVVAGRQFASAVRRVWWPLVAIGALRSKRCRVILIAALLADLTAAPTDLAYGWGVWKGMMRHRTLTPIIPRLRPWPRIRPPRTAPSTAPIVSPQTVVDAVSGVAG